MLSSWVRPQWHQLLLPFVWSRCAIFGFVLLGQKKTRYISQISIDDVEIFDEWFEMEIVQQRGRESGTGRHTYSYNTDIACRPTERRNQSVHAIIHLVNYARPFFHPRGKQHFRDLPTLDWASQLTKITYYLVCMTRRQVLAQSYVGKSRKCCFPHDSEPQKLYAPQTKILEG